MENTFLDPRPYYDTDTLKDEPMDFIFQERGAGFINYLTSYTINMTYEERKEYLNQLYGYKEDKDGEN